jgi:hypothetical protein
MVQRDKHTSTMIRKKWRRGPQYSCCGKGFSGNITKPMKGRFHCTQIRFLKSRDRIVMAKEEIREVMR